MNPLRPQWAHIITLIKETPQKLTISSTTMMTVHSLVGGHAVEEGSHYRESLSWHSNPNLEETELRVKMKSLLISSPHSKFCH